MLSHVGSVSDDKLEERFFHDRLHCLVERGGAGLRKGAPYIFERVCPTSHAYSLGGRIVKVQVRVRGKVGVVCVKNSK